MSLDVDQKRTFEDTVSLPSGDNETASSHLDSETNHSLTGDIIADLRIQQEEPGVLEA